MIPYYLTKLWQKLVIPNSPSCVFAFWNGMTYETQIHIIELCVLCPTVKTFAVFRDKVRDKWADPDEGQSPSVTVSPLEFWLYLVAQDQQP